MYLARVFSELLYSSMSFASHIIEKRVPFYQTCLANSRVSSMFQCFVPRNDLTPDICSRFIILNTFAKQIKYPAQLSTAYILIDASTSKHTILQTS